MAYEVRLTDRAMRDLLLLHEAIHASESATALRWYLGLKRAILSLEERPNRCPRAPESVALRHLLYGRKLQVYRIIFRVDQARQQVNVLHIRHGARKALQRKQNV